MTALLKPELISIQEYLEGELLSEVRHEYIGGCVYAMAGASDDHNRIGGNIFSFLHAALRGKRCEPFGSDMKFKIPRFDSFYYPDVMVTCDPTDDAKYFRERPTVVFEVLSPETERTDTREKRYAYDTVEALKVYVLVAQDRTEAVIYRRTPEGAWSTETVQGLNATLQLPEIAIEIPFARIYERTAVVTRA